jgi:hypothetical protein
MGLIACRVSIELPATSQSMGVNKEKFSMLTSVTSVRSSGRGKRSRPSAV